MPVQGIYPGAEESPLSTSHDSQLTNLYVCMYVCMYVCTYPPPHMTCILLLNFVLFKLYLMREANQGYTCILLLI